MQSDNFVQNKDLPKDFRVTPLKRDQTAVYRILDIKPDPHNIGRHMVPFAKNVPATDEIVTDNGDVFPIAYIQRTEPNGEAVFGDITFYKKDAGNIILRGDRAADQKLYLFMENSNYNASNPNRSKARAAIFKRVDEGKDAEARRADRLLIQDAINKAIDLDENNLKFVASALGISLKAKEAVLRDKVEEYAEDYPEDFLEILEQQTNETESLVREAIDLGIVFHNHKSGKFVWKESGEDIFAYKKQVGVKFYYEFANHLQTKDAETLDAIKVRVKAQRDNS